MENPQITKPRRARRCAECGSTAHDSRTCPKVKAKHNGGGHGLAVRRSPEGGALAMLLDTKKREELRAVVAVCEALKPVPAQRREVCFRAALALLALSGVPF